MSTDPPVQCHIADRPGQTCQADRADAVHAGPAFTDIDAPQAGPLAPRHATQHATQRIGAPIIDPASFHPAVWLGSQLARWDTQCVDTGQPALSAVLPGGGWPQGALTELLLPQAGIGEIRLLQPALTGAGRRGIVLLQPPYIPQGMAWLGWRQDPARLTWVRAERTADALWSAEQILRSGACGALLFWQDAIRPDALRRLHLAAQSGNALFFMLRPANAAHDASPAPLRLALAPLPGGVRITLLKRRGPPYELPLDLTFDALCPSFTSTHSTPPTRHAPVDWPLSPIPVARRVPADMAG